MKSFVLRIIIWRRRSRGNQPTGGQLQAETCREPHRPNHGLSLPQLTVMAAVIFPGSAEWFE
jgi:hypothetical protein